MDNYQAHLNNWEETASLPKMLGWLFFTVIFFVNISAFDDSTTQKISLIPVLMSVFFYKTFVLVSIYQFHTLR